MLKDNIFALDLGTTKFCIAALICRGRARPGIEVVEVPARGMRRGMLSNLEEAAEGINQLLEKAEDQFNTPIKKVVVGVAGSHLRGRLISLSTELDHAEVRQICIKNLIRLAGQEARSADREILHTVPVGYQVDNREWTDHPLGFSGGRLTGRFYVIDADQKYLLDIIKICNRCGLEVAHLYSEPFASATVTVPDDKKALGVALADIGGGTTDGIVFAGGKPVDSFTINVGGRMMTSDLAIGLALQPEEAEKIKVYFGLELSEQERSIRVRNIHDQEVTVTPADVYPVLGPRILELGSLLAEALMPHKGKLAGIMLTGGGAEVQGLSRFLSRSYRVHVEKSQPTLEHNHLTRNADGHQKKFATKHATVFGLLNLEISRRSSREATANSSWPRHYLGQFFNWVKEMS